MFSLFEFVVLNCLRCVNSGFVRLASGWFDVGFDWLLLFLILMLVGFGIYLDFCFKFDLRLCFACC